jgi:hypothetical protein
MAEQEPYRECIVYPKGYGETSPFEGMPSMDEIELLSHLETTVTKIMLLPHDQQKMVIAELTKKGTVFSKIVLQMMYARKYQGGQRKQ